MGKKKPTSKGGGSKGKAGSDKVAGIRSILRTRTYRTVRLAQILLGMLPDSLFPVNVLFGVKTQNMPKQNKMRYSLQTRNTKTYKLTIGMEKPGGKRKFGNPDIGVFSINLRKISVFLQK
jgi:hypothetical protein